VRGVTALVQLALLFVASLGLTLVLGGPLIEALKRAALRQHAYEDAPQTHAVKSGTPTMGGLLFLAGLVLALIWHPDGQTAALAVIGVLCGLIGFTDDLRSIRQERNRGLSAREKFAMTAFAGLALLWIAGNVVPPEAQGALLSFGGWTLRGPLWLWYALGLAAVLATTHAVNLTDGLDGLAAGTVLPPLGLFAWLAWRGGFTGVAFGDVALAGSALGFLNFNRYPARVFMGDTGALALGGVLAGSAFLSGNVLLLPLVGGVFAAETLSVILQVASYKTTRKRIFRMSPLHHHFELGGWPETKVTFRFWTASALLSLAGAALAR
jgi:phospho-N-acetylmuramoyl-pentapeptide-transferase